MIDLLLALGGGVLLSLIGALLWSRRQRPAPRNPTPEPTLRPVSTVTLDLAEEVADEVTDEIDAIDADARIDRGADAVAAGSPFAERLRRLPKE